MKGKQQVYIKTIKILIYRSLPLEGGNEETAPELHFGFYSLLFFQDDRVCQIGTDIFGKYSVVHFRLL